MAQVTVRIPTPLRTYTGGADEVSVQADTVADALRALEQQHEGLLRYIISDDGGLRPFVNVFVGDRDVRAIGGLDAKLEPGSVISVLPAVAGGSVALGQPSAAAGSAVPGQPPAASASVVTSRPTVSAALAATERFR